MELHLYKTLWGEPGKRVKACEIAAEKGFNGIEGPAPANLVKREEFREALEAHHLDYIAEVTTAGSYVPERRATLKDHLESLKTKLDIAATLNPSLVTCLGGCDAWPEALSIEFFGQALEMAEKAGVEISFETHRGRSLFNPWVTRRICEQLPELQLTCDFSHWCVVCERLLDIDDEDMGFYFKRARHIHARVGYDQGPQVADPAAAHYSQALEVHKTYWRSIWEIQKARGLEISTATPEFGPDGYQQVDVQTGRSVGDLALMNEWMADCLRGMFRQAIQPVEATPMAGAMR